MKNKADIQEELDRLKRDERVSYPPANVFSNSPLALIQTDLKSRINTLEWVLGVKLTNFPRFKTKG